MQQQAHIIAQRLLNLYRQEHVIDGGWSAVNQVFIDESNDEQVIAELENLPTGKKLIAHINNLRSGQTPMDSIDNDLLPYGGLMTGQTLSVSLTQSEIEDIKSALNNFETTPEGLEKIKSLPYIKRFGDNWVQDIKSALSSDATASMQWERVARTEKAFKLWDSAQELISETLTDRNRAQIQADMPEFETYLPMFGEQGNELLAKLRTFISSLS